ncbi:hypothetical protein F511_04265 [Dorcoceras hygrometricum]|uniref:Uncharacterized protein n=1 Tax=Dorcoceras hygrometricum TaxID=472368 RepID=A0A2Z7CVE7_9LAMI|nr:hypothetical protein F511_04265 [Dorcoceras hygrometricum]
MGCPGQARTKPRRKISRRNEAGYVAGQRPHGGGRRHHVVCGAWPHACRIVRGAWRWLRQPVAQRFSPDRPPEAHDCATNFATALATAGLHRAKDCAASSSQRPISMREAAPSIRPPCATSAHDIARPARSRAMVSAAACSGRQAKTNFVVQSEIRELDAIQATIVLKDPSLGSETTVGETVADPDPVSRRRSGSAWLRPVSRGNRHFTEGGGRLRLIRSTTGSKVPSSACTRRPDEISTDGNFSKSWPEQIPARGGGGGDGGGRRRRLWERREAAERESSRV